MAKPYKKLNIKNKETGKYTDIAAIFKGDRGDFFLFDRNVVAIKLADGTVLDVSVKTDENGKRVSKFFYNVQDNQTQATSRRSSPEDDDLGF